MAGSSEPGVCGLPSASALITELGVYYLSPSRDVFPQGLPDEYAFVTTFRLRKTSRKEDWYIWQVIDQYGIPQVGAACLVACLSRPAASVSFSRGWHRPPCLLQAVGLRLLGNKESWGVSPYAPCLAVSIRGPR